MYARLVCDPPLGHAINIPLEQDSVTFSVVLESSASKSRAWDVEIWHNHASAGDWGALRLEEVDAAIGDVLPGNVNRRYFQGVLSGKPSDKDVCSFTARYRSASEEKWNWIRDRTSLPDGQLCYQKFKISEHRGLKQYFPHIDSSLNVSEARYESLDVGTRVYGISGPVAGAEGKQSSIQTWKFGVPAGFSRFLAVVRLWSPWFAPRHGRTKFQIDKNALMLAFLMEDGTHVVLVAVSGIGDMQTFFTSDDAGSVVLNGRNDATSQGWAQVVIAVGQTFEETNAAAMYQAREMVMKNWTPDSPDQTLWTLETDFATQKNDYEAEWFQEWYEGFSYCTWNGLGQNLNEQKILDALEELRKKDINITSLIIDDNWQSLDHAGEGQNRRRWLEFEANKDGFPNGLAHTVRTLREQNPNLQHIAVWHAILGYWGAISPDGKIAQKYKTMTVKQERREMMESWLVVHPDDVSQFYQDFYSFLSESGIDSVKTDAQFTLDEIFEAPDRRALTKAYQDAWTVSILRFFAGRAISCMSQVPQITFHSQMPTSRTRMLLRNSDDFFPDIEDSHPWHVYCNAYNTLFTQHLNALPDWDMFQTSHPWAAFHAAARCVSGGPIYFTDTPGKHDVDLIRQMTANTSRGDTIILRPSVVGKTVQPYVGYDALRLLKIATYHGYARTGSSILGVFNVAQQSIIEVIRLHDFPGTEQGEYVVRSHVTGVCSKPTSREGKGAKVIVADMSVKGYDILTCHHVFGPIKIRNAGQMKIANLGLIGKMTGSAGVINTTIDHDQNWSVKFWTSLKALGTLGLYISDLEDRELEEDFMVIVTGQPVPIHGVKKSKEANVLEIDVARAWKEGKHEPGWSNEVVVEVLIR